MLSDIIGVPASLEGLAEECTELAQAALKYARHLRGENPVRKSEEELRENLIEEFAHVYIMSREVIFNTNLITYKEINEAVHQRMQDMDLRFAEAERKHHDTETAENR